MRTETTLRNPVVLQLLTEAALARCAYERSPSEVTRYRHAKAGCRAAAVIAFLNHQ